MARGDVKGTRVLFVTYYYAPHTSGLAVYIERLAESLAARGAQVTVLTGRHMRSLPLREVINSVRVVRVRALARIDRGLVLPGLIPAALRWSRRSDVVIFVLPLVEAGLLTWLVPQEKQRPSYVCDLRLEPRLLSKLIQRISDASARAAVRRAPAHFALSRDYAQASRILKPFQTRTIALPPTVEPHLFSPRDPAQLRERLGIPAGPVVGFVGRLVHEKGLPVLIRAFARAQRERTDLRLAIAGEGVALAGPGVLSHLRELVAGNPSIALTGFVPHDELPAFYSMCSVLALPSIDPVEAFGIVQLEAMLCGCPVVASDLPGVRLPVQRTGMGMLVPPQDERALAAALIEVVEARDRFVAARVEILREFNPEVSYARIADSVASVTKQQAEPLRVSGDAQPQPRAAPKERS